MTDFQGDKVTKYTQLLSNISNCGSKAKRLPILQKIECQVNLADWFEIFLMICKVAPHTKYLI